VTRHISRPVIFGLCDGAMSIMGVVLYAARHTSLVFPIAVSGGFSAAVSMAGSEWLSKSHNGLREAAAMGAATLAGSVLPAVPYAFLHGWHALAVSVLAVTAVAVAVSLLRRERDHPYLETFAVLAAVLAIAAACVAVLPGR
jgi:VIT1/CCC1 family predicted Fe2+/Mn2+ transporter